MVMDAVGSAASAVGEAIGLIKPKKAKLVVVSDIKPKHAEEIDCMFNPTEYIADPDCQGHVHQRTEQARGHRGVRRHECPEAGGDAVLRRVRARPTATSPRRSPVSCRGRCPWRRPGREAVRLRRSWPSVWGNSQLENFCGYLTSVDVKYKLFSRYGKPLRADVTIALEGATPDFERNQPDVPRDRHDADPHRRRGRDPPGGRLHRARQAGLLAGDRRHERHRRSAPGRARLGPAHPERRPTRPGTPEADDAARDQRSRPSRPRSRSRPGSSRSIRPGWTTPSRASSSRRRSSTGCTCPTRSRSSSGTRSATSSTGRSSRSASA